MLIAVVLIGFFFLALVVKLAEGLVKLVLIIILLALIAGGFVASTHNGNESLPTSTNL